MVGFWELPKFIGIYKSFGMLDMMMHKMWWLAKVMKVVGSSFV